MQLKNKDKFNINIKEININLNQADIYNSFKDEEESVLLDSAKEDKALGKYSFIGVNPISNFKVVGDKGLTKVFIDNKEHIGDAFSLLGEFNKSFSISEDKVKEIKEKHNIDIPFLAGAIGFISYDALRLIETIEDINKEDFKIPFLKFNLYKNLIIFDHIKDKKYVTELIRDNEVSNIDSIIDKIKNTKAMEALDVENIKNIEIKENKVIVEMTSSIKKEFYSDFTKDEYKDAVSNIKEYIRSGDTYITNMTQRFYCVNNNESYNIYRKLREINKAPFAAYLNYEDFQVISASPERFINIIDGKITTRPIKGTRPRGKTKEEDNINKEALLNSEKDKAELLMVVDLERNDLSKVCKPHSVKVTELFELETYATVFHLVSTVEGILDKNITSADALKGVFPGGSITGTPKIRTTEIIEELERVKRGLYTGAIGYFDISGNCDFNIVIRTIIKNKDKAYFGVGGGITYDSIEEDEYNETLDKARALMRVL